MKKIRLRNITMIRLTPQTNKIIFTNKSLLNDGKLKIQRERMSDNTRDLNQPLKKTRIIHQLQMKITILIYRGHSLEERQQSVQIKMIIYKKQLKKLLKFEINMRPKKTTFNLMIKKEISYRHLNIKTIQYRPRTTFQIRNKIQMGVTNSFLLNHLKTRISLIILSKIKIFDHIIQINVFSSININNKIHLNGKENKWTIKHRVKFKLHLNHIYQIYLYLNKKNKNKKSIICPKMSKKLNQQDKGLIPMSEE